MKKRKILLGIIALMLITGVGCSSTTSNSDTDNKTSVKTTEEVVESKVLVDDNIVKIEMVGIEDNSFYDGKDIKLKITNKTDSTICVQTREMSIDGTMVADNTIFSDEISGGMKSNDEITVIEFSGDVVNVKGKFHIFNSDGWDTLEDVDFEF